MRTDIDYNGKTVLVVGMAKSGISAARLLLQLGARVVLHDRKTADNFEVNELLAAGAENAMGCDPAAAAQAADVLVLSPGVPTKQPFIEAAAAAGKPVISEIELGYQTSEADFVCISGTNGKTTTTALTGEIFKNGGRSTYVLGNIGVPICDRSLCTRPGDVVVAEVAALQLETIDTFRPRAAALLNVTEDHMDRFGTMEYYTHCKMREFENQGEGDFAVLNWDDPITRAQAEHIHSRLLWFSRREQPGEGAFIEDGNIIFIMNGRRELICPADQVAIPGAHNLENALAAVCLARAMGVGAGEIAFTLHTFPGVEHRIEFVREVDGVRYINDSKGTNPDATIKAIEAMKAPTVLILGGYDKQSEFDGLFAAFTENIKTVVLLGATREKLLVAAKKAGFDDVRLAGSFEEAVEMARRAAPEGGNVLLSPACASWDMFDNFEQRGEVFKKIVADF